MRSTTSSASPASSAPPPTKPTLAKIAHAEPLLCFRDVCKKIDVFGVPDTMKVGELSEEMAKRKIVCTPVANEAGEMYGFVDMMDLCTCALKTINGMLAAVSLVTGRSI